MKKRKLHLIFDYFFAKPIGTEPEAGLTIVEITECGPHLQVADDRQLKAGDVVAVHMAKPLYRTSDLVGIYEDEGAEL